MNNGGLILIVGSLIAAASAFIWVAFKLESGPRRRNSKTQSDYLSSGKEDVEHLFNDDFREELRNRGRLHFEKIIGENAAFLQQDLRQTTGQLNHYMRDEITRTLQDEFKKYEQSITDAKQIAQESIQKTAAMIEQQRQLLAEELKSQSDAQKAHIIARFEEDMTSIVNHYVLKAIGNQIDLTDQLDFILSELESNKQAIVEDIKNGTS